MADVAIGLKNLYIGDIAADGGIGTVFEPVSYSVEGTPVLTMEEGETTDFPIEESDDPFYSITNPGNKVLTLSIYGLSPEVLEKYFGGTVTPGATSADPSSWAAPAQFPALEKSIIAVHKQGGHLRIARAKISGLFNWAFQKNALPQIDLTVTILTPTKLAEPSMVFDQAEYVP